MDVIMGKLPEVDTDAHKSGYWLDRAQRLNERGVTDFYGTPVENPTAEQTRRHDEEIARCMRYARDPKLYDEDEKAKAREAAGLPSDAILRPTTAAGKAAYAAGLPNWRDKERAALGDEREENPAPTVAQVVEAVRGMSHEDMLEVIRAVNGSGRFGAPFTNGTEAV